MHGYYSGQMTTELHPAASIDHAHRLLLGSCALRHEDVPLQTPQGVTQHIGAGDPTHGSKGGLQQARLLWEARMHRGLHCISAHMSQPAAACMQKTQLHRRGHNDNLRLNTRMRHRTQVSCIWCACRHLLFRE